MPRLRTFALGVALIAPVLAPAFASAGAAACAAERTGQPHAALVVDTGSRTTTYCVGLDAASVSGIHLIQLAGAQYGLAYQLGFGSQAICQLDGIGPSGGDCFGDYPDYWGYWRGDGAGGWTWAGSGAASSSIGQGDLEGWVFGPGDSGATHPAPPALAFDDVCDSTPTPRPTPSPKPSPGPSPTPNPGPGSGSGGGGASAEPSTSSGTAEASTSGHQPRSSPAPTTSPTPRAEASPTSEIVRAVATSGTAPKAPGPPIGAAAVAVAVAGLWGAGWFTLRRRRRDERA